MNDLADEQGKAFYALRFGKWLRAERKAKGLKIVALAKRSSVSASHISMAENGQRGMEREQIAKIAKGLANNSEDANEVEIIKEAGLRKAGLISQTELSHIIVSPERAPVHRNLEALDNETFAIIEAAITKANAQQGYTEETGEEGLIGKKAE